jgi:hypothetical protein
MKTKSLIPAALALTLLLSASASMAEQPVNLLGDAEPATAANRTVTIAPDTKYVNVQGGQTVKFDVDGKSFAWNFSGPSTVSSFDLNRVAPPGLLDHNVTVYIAPNPLYLG